jgi:hypothetical protein
MAFSRSVVVLVTIWSTISFTVCALGILGLFSTNVIGLTSSLYISREKNTPERVEKLVGDCEI